MNNSLCFIDFEASSLNPSSYPIEVAWSLEDGSIESHMINPYAIETWMDWDPASQAVHGLSRNILSNEGKHPKWVAQRMNTVLADKVLLTNAYDWDWDWCDTLFKAAQESMQFKFGDAWHVFGQKLNLEPSIGNVVLEQPVSAQAMNDALRKFSDSAWQRITGKRHRASVDVQQLQLMLALIDEHNRERINS